MGSISGLKRGISSALSYVGNPEKNSTDKITLVQNKFFTTGGTEDTYKLNYLSQRSQGSQRRTDLYSHRDLCVLRERQIVHLEFQLLDSIEVI